MPLRDVPADPPTLIGGSGSEIPPQSICIDWIGLTIPNGAKQPQSPYLQALATEYEETTGLHGYNRGRRYGDGRIMLDHTNRPEMGTHWVFSGSTLNKLAEAGFMSWHVLGVYRGVGAKITRLDLAIDCKNTGLDLREIERLIDAGEYDASSRKFTRVTGVGDTPGFTLYIGSRQSEAFGRFYDKAAQTRTGGDWIRLEIELKGVKATFVADRIVSGGLPVMRAIVPGLIRNLIDFPTYSVWQSVLSSEKTITPNSHKLDTNTKRWLMEAVAPVMGRTLAREAQDALWFDFQQAVFAEKAKHEAKLVDTTLTKPVQKA